MAKNILEARCTHCNTIQIVAKREKPGEKLVWIPEEDMFPGCPGDAIVLLVVLDDMEQYGD